MTRAEAQTGAQPASKELIRVLFVSHDTAMFGAQRTLLTLLSAIDRSAISPLLVVPHDGPLGHAAAELDIPVFIRKRVPWVPVLDGSSGGNRLRHLFRFLRTLHTRCRALEELIASHGVELVYTNTVTCIEGAIAARRTRKPHVWHIHESILGNRDLMPLLPYRLLCAAVGFLSRSIIFCSRTVARDYPALSGKASVVHNGLPVSPLRNRRAARSEAEREFGIEAGAKIVAVVSALTPGKDHLTFLAAAEQVARRVENAVFLIVGSGSEQYTQTIRRQIAELCLDSRVRLLGWRDDIQDLLAAIDVLVISSRQESFGLTAIEALAMEIPVVATKCGGPEEVVEEGVTGLLIPVKDPLALADAIVSLLLDPKLARRLGENGRNHVSEHFGVDRYVHGIQRIIQDTAATKGKS